MNKRNQKKWLNLSGLAGLIGNRPTPLNPHLQDPHTSPSSPSSEQDHISQLHGLLNDMVRMQQSSDLLERYQYFIEVTENTLNHALGPATISLWCPDQDEKNLLECVIRPTTSSDDLSRDALAPAAARPPCRVPLDSPPIRRTLQSGQPYLAEAKAPHHHPDANHPALRCDACIALYREYGQPLLVIVERQGRLHNPPPREAFKAAVELVKLFWQQLQATNQRQWIIEHDPASGALRDDVFLPQAQALAEKACHIDELFTVVVIAVHGFRRMFADQSQQWRTLTGLFARSLRHILNQENKNFLLAKMADDVFALMLPRADEFITRSIMQKLIDRLPDQMTRDHQINNLQVMALDVRWAHADHRQYQGSIEKMLEKIYRRLFDPQQTEQQNLHHIVLAAEVID